MHRGDHRGDVVGVDVLVNAVAEVEYVTAARTIAG